MTAAKLDSLDREVIESVLQMGAGYVLDFSDRTFAEFFEDHGVAIDEPAYRIQGTSKANRMRAFLKAADADLVGRVLGALLERRLLKDPEGLNPKELERYRSVVARLGGAASPVADSGTEAELLRRVFRPERFAKLPIDALLGQTLVARMEEAHRCIEGKSYLAAVILCGSVLEGICLGFGIRDPERVNRAFGSKYGKPAPPFHEWKLRQWIDVLGALGDLSPNVEKFGQALRDFRNYVHPAEQLAHRFVPDDHTARIGFQVVVAAVDDLVRAAARAGGAP